MQSWIDTKKRRLSLAQDFHWWLAPLGRQACCRCRFPGSVAAFAQPTHLACAKAEPTFLGRDVDSRVGCIFGLAVIILCMAGVYMCRVHAVPAIVQPAFACINVLVLGECAFRFRLAGHVVCC